MSKYLTLREYEDMAIKYLKHFNKHEDPTAIDIVMSHIIKADQKFDPNKNNNQTKFRYLYAKYGWYHYLAQTKAQNKKPVISYSLIPSVTRLVEDTRWESNPVERTELRDLLEAGMEVLTKREMDFVIQYYLHGMTYREVAKANNTYTNDVFRVVRRGLRKLRELAYVEENNS